jgi:hypothetical protein
MSKQQQADKPGSLRGVMPQTAELVDWLRASLGKEAADQIIAKGKAGQGGFYMAEVGPDGLLREFGSTQGGRRAQVVDGALQLAERRRT